ncbi:MAG: NAD(P)H-quinone oxidoreductase [Pseudomonadota bacterium]
MPDLARQMHCVEIVKAGGPEVLQLATRPTPFPAPDEILIKTAFIGVNRPDALQRAGLYPPPKGASDLPGLEASGVVIDKGAEVTRWKVGDTVCALTNGGAYAEYVAVHQDHALAPPEGLDLAEAAALPETIFTVWSNVFERAGLKEGESFLVHGGSSGIGTTAIQLAAAFGARVFATAGSTEKCAACETLGAEIAVNYHEADFVDVLKEATQKRGVDVILDMVGGDYLPRNARLAAEDGRIVNIAFLRGPSAEFNFALMMLKRLTLSGSTLRPRSVAYKAALARTVEETVWPLIAEGRFKPVMDQRFALADASKAHARMESGAHIGKIILEV